MKIDIIRAMKNIAAAYPVSECGGINSFAVLDDPGDDESSSFGKTIRDYDGGVFWSRDWVAGGADPSELKVQYPILFLESRSGKLQYEADNNAGQCFDFVIVVAGQYLCDDCPCQKTAQEVEDEAATTITNYVNELSTLELMEVTYDDMTTARFLLTRAQVDYMVMQSEISYYTIINSVSINSDFTFRSWGFGSTRRLRGVSMRVQICACAGLLATFDYSQPDVERVSVTKCDSCN